MSPDCLAYKLKIKPGTRAALLNPPEGYLLALCPERVTFDYDLFDEYEWIQVFVHGKMELDEIFPRLVVSLVPNGLLWISFPKANADLRNELTRHPGREVVTGLKRLKLVSINQSWSAFSFRPLRPEETQVFPSEKEYAF